MNEPNLRDPLFIERALGQPGDAIGYHLGRTLIDAAGGAHLVETMDSELDFWALAEEGFCEAEKVPGVHAEVELGPDQRSVRSNTIAFVRPGSAAI